MKILLAALPLLILLPASTATCQSFCASVPCYAQTCGNGCVCIQPNGPGSEGFCNSR